MIKLRRFFIPYDKMYSLYICLKIILVHKIFIIILFLFPCILFAQVLEDSIIKDVDSLYREDQFYVGLTFNLLTNKPGDFSQNGLSAGLQFGFIRDFPINKRRNKAIGVGLGLAIDTYNQDLFIDEDASGSLIYSILDDDAGEDVNRFTVYTLELPLEYRWRTSTPDKYAFWRIYAGIKVGYILSFNTTFEDDNADVLIKDLSPINRLQYGPSLSFGYSTFNFQAYYGLNSIFNDNAIVENETIDLQVLRLGLVFYFL